MSRLTVFLDRRLSRWRTPRALFGGMLAGLHPARIARRIWISCDWRVVALPPTSFDACCTRLGAAPVASAAALLAGPIGAARIWSLEATEPVADHSRIAIVEGVRQPSHDAAARIYPPTRQAYLRLRSVNVFPPTGLVMPEPGVVLRNNLWRWWPDHRLMPGFLGFVDDMLIARADDLRPSRHIHQTMLVLCHPFERNYAHWLFDLLPRLLPWLGMLRQTRLMALVSPLNGWQRRTLELLGVPASAMVEASEPSILCDDIIVPGLRTATDAAPNPAPTFDLPQPGPAVIETIEILRTATRPEAAIEQPERIYVSRCGAQSFRELRNEGEVEAAMTGIGFTMMHPETLTFDQQVAAFARARIIAGPHGAGLTNAIFAPKGCLVVEVHPDVWHPNWMLRVTQVFGHHYLPMLYASDPALSTPVMSGSAIVAHRHVFDVPADAFAAVVVAAMRRLGIERLAAE